MLTQPRFLRLRFDDDALRGRSEAPVSAERQNSMPIADLNSRAQILILAARVELRPAAGERERLEALVSARIGAREPWISVEHSSSRSPDSVR